VVTAAAAADAAGTGVYQYVLSPAQTAGLDDYRVEWKYALAAGGPQNTKTAYFRVVGQTYATIDELRAFSDGLFTDQVAYPTRTLVNYRDLAEELLERECGVAFSPQGRRLRMDGTGETLLPLPVRRARRVVSVTIDDTALDAGELAELKVYSSEVYRPAGWPAAVGSRNVELHLEHGYDEPPEQIREATKWIVRDLAETPPSDLDTRAQAVTNDRGTQSLGVAGKDGPTGMPYVDAVIARFTEPAAEVGSVAIRSEAAWPTESS
jgi:hypothetical protein